MGGSTTINGVNKSFGGGWVSVGGVWRELSAGWVTKDGSWQKILSGLDILFGTGEDGDLYIASGQTVTLSVPSQYISVVEMNYKSITIESGGTLICDKNNAGLVLRCQGDCIINGTVDQKGKSGLPNPNTTFDYPDEIVCGNGGNGGKGGISSWTRTPASGGSGMSGHKGGGGWSAGGAGGAFGYDYLGGKGGDTYHLTYEHASAGLFVGGAAHGSSGTANAVAGNPGSNGGGGGGAYLRGGAGGSGPGGAGNTGGPCGGGAGNYGGGVVMLYIGGNTTINGTINCDGATGGQGGNGPNGTSANYMPGGGGGGGGGGAIYIVYNGDYDNYGAVTVNGGTGGAYGILGNQQDGYVGAAGSAGGIGSVTVKHFEKGMIK